MIKYFVYFPGGFSVVKEGQDPPDLTPSIMCFPEKTFLMPRGLDKLPG